MTTHPHSRSNAAKQNDDGRDSTAALRHRVAALELLVQNLVFVLDARGALNADAFADWLDTAVCRMRATRSVPDAEANALHALAREVVR